MLSMSSSVSVEWRREISTSSRAERGEVEVVAVLTPASPSLGDPALPPTWGEDRDWETGGQGEGPDLALELAEEQRDDHQEGEARQAGQHDEDGLLQPAGPVRAGGADVDKVIVLIEIWRNIVWNRIMV